MTQVIHQGSGGTITSGQTIPVSEPIGLLDYGNGIFTKSVIEDCEELRQNSTYVLFVEKHPDGSYLLTGFNMGRFNMDGTDPEDEVGGIVNSDGTPTDKQKLREELTSRYGILFNFLPDTKIVSARNVYSTPPGPGERRFPTFITVSLGAPRPEGTSLIVERKMADAEWTVFQQSPVAETKPSETTPEEKEIVLSSQVLAGESLRVRLVNGTRTSNYSEAFPLVASPPPTTP